MLWQVNKIEQYIMSKTIFRENLQCKEIDNR